MSLQFIAWLIVFSSPEFGEVPFETSVVDTNGFPLTNWTFNSYSLEDTDPQNASWEITDLGQIGPVFRRGIVRSFNSVKGKIEIGYNDGNFERRKSEEISLLPVEIKTETIATQPQNRNRKKLGIGEEVLLLVVTPTDAQVQWSIFSGSGNVSTIFQKIGKFDAAEMNEKVKIRATFTNYGNATIDTEFQVCTPETVKFEIDVNHMFNIVHVDDLQATARTNAYFYFGPDDVNFYGSVGIWV